LSWGCLILFIVEFYYGAIGFLPFIFLMSISPALYYVVNIFSFPIRLQLSELTCYLFNLVGLTMVNKGSYFVLAGGQEFHIDQACVGLKMFGTGYISALIILAFKQQKLGLQIPFVKLVFWMLVITVLLLLTNLFRIMGLVFFRSMPDTLSHNLIGLFALLVYAILPYYFLVNQYLNINIIQNQNQFLGKFRIVQIPLVFLVIAAFLSFKFKENRVEQRRDLVLAQLEIPGFTKEEKEDGVMEFRNDSLLIYIKPAIRPFEGGHPPQICWRASGFELSNFNELTSGSSSYMFGLLKKNKQQQFTAWWYDNGSVQTVHEWEWRKKNEAPFRVINICAKDSSTIVNLLKNGLKIPGITVALSQTQ
jgi:exosortase N